MVWTSSSNHPFLQIILMLNLKCGIELTIPSPYQHRRRLPSLLSDSFSKSFCLGSTAAGGKVDGCEAQGLSDCGLEVGQPRQPLRGQPPPPAQHSLDFLKINLVMNDCTLTTKKIAQFELRLPSTLWAIEKNDAFNLRNSPIPKY